MPDFSDMYVDFPPASEEDCAPADYGHVVPEKLSDWLSELAQAIAGADGIEIALTSKDPAVRDVIAQVLGERAGAEYESSHERARLILNIGGCHPKGAGPDGPDAVTLCEFGPGQ